MVEVLRANIVEVDVEAIVNAANSSLLGGGGVDGAIHRAAGPGLLEECRTLGGCEVGQVKVTGGHLLPIRYILHTVGPIWRGGEAGEVDLLASCYRNALRQARALSVKSIAFPAISTGVYGFPSDRAAQIAIDICLAWNTTDSMRIVLVAFDAQSAHHLEGALGAAKNV